MQANRALDAAVTAAHDQDAERADVLLDFLVTEPLKRIARRVVVRLQEQARDDGAADPALAKEMALRRALAASPERPEPSARDLQASMACVNRVANGSVR